jgi:hypothetical protein
VSVQVQLARQLVLLLAWLLPGPHQWLVLLPQVLLGSV